MSTDDDGLADGLKAAAQHEADRLADPYSYSELAVFVELDTWRTEQALMLMAGIAPTGADIKSSYKNFLGVRVNAPKIVNAQLLTEADLFYLTPWESATTGHDARTPAEKAEMLAKREKLKQAGQRYRRILRLWDSDPDQASVSSLPVQKFLDWADSKNIYVPWRAWYEALRTTPSRKQERAHLTTEGNADDDIAAWFDPVPVATLETMFPAAGKWANWAERAADNGLKAARPARGQFNPYRAGLWFFKRGLPGWDQAHVYRVLANNLPARSQDKRELLAP